MSVACHSCGDRVERAYDCLHCAEVFCVDCRVPAEHGCDAASGGDDGVVEADTERVVGLLERGRRRWHSLPWYYPLGAALVLVPVAWVVYAVHIYVDRTTAPESEWTPRFAFYLPVFAFFLLFVGIANQVVAPMVLEVVGTWLVVLACTVVYAVQRVRHG